MTSTLIICLSGGVPNLSRRYDWRLGKLLGRVYEIKGTSGGINLWPLLADQLINLSMGLGLINYPSPIAETNRLKLYVPSTAVGDPRILAVPKELRADLADYHDGVRSNNAIRLYKDHEQIFAEQAAAARIITEHTARLALTHGPDIVCLGFGALPQIQGLSGLHHSYPDLYVDQVMRHTDSLARRLGAATVLCLSDGASGQRPVALHFAVSGRGPHPDSEVLDLEELGRLAAGE